MTRLEAFCRAVTNDLVLVGVLPRSELLETTIASIVKRRAKALIDDIDVSHYGVESYMSGDADD